MGLTAVLARLAVKAAQVLVVEVPGQWSTRVELERQMLRRGWRTAWTPADADVLMVCGVPGPELARNIERLWEQMPGPRARIHIGSPAAVASALDGAAASLLDTRQQRQDARDRPQKPQIPQGHEGMDHGDMGHGDDGGSGGEPQNHQDHEGMDHGDEGGQEGMDHGDMDHEGMDHGSMDMAPEGIALAEGGGDRDGLEMDILHLPLGPVLPFWPAGLVLDCSLHGDVVAEAEAGVVDGGQCGGMDGSAPAGLLSGRPSAAVWCDNAMALLALAGAEDAAACARRARDAVLDGAEQAARGAVARLHRTVCRSRLLRWSLRAVLPLDETDLQRHGLPARCRGDAYDRLLWLVEAARAGVGGKDQESQAGALVPVPALGHLVAGMELAAVRLAVASLALEPLPVMQEVAHG